MNALSAVLQPINYRLNYENQHNCDSGTESINETLEGLSNTADTPISHYKVTRSEFPFMTIKKQLADNVSTHSRDTASPSPDSGYSTPAEDPIPQTTTASKKRRYHPYPKSLKEMCSVGQGIYIEPSTLPYSDVGNGAFIDHPFEKGAFVTWYDGYRKHFKSEAERNEHKMDLNASTHTRKINRDVVIIGIRDPELAAVIDTQTGHSMGAGSFINDPLDPQKVNVIFCAPDSAEKPHIYVKATKDLDRGSELFATYDDDFWRRRGGKPKKIKPSIDQTEQGIKPTTNNLIKTGQ
ncbi:SET domain-containing protein-lysine N-methyltransferase [Endozoicomonas elysicola]|uniref:SET domain-containing protein n=1 Tax=Endozoicomonas elysicola TaxID=305900 RepID=A0A081K6J7_9GAMM|nr:SET domain-containing protein-lysine N-methyltransferase [Endozoicomonas elysicola]KEI69773.1 hypothetical protein GV64_02575 [Endozoicomonas elysicola]